MNIIYRLSCIRFFIQKSLKNRKIYNMEYKYTGIVLSKKDIGEADRLYNIYTLEQGKITVIARGVRKPKSKLAGKLENFYLIDFTVMKNRGMGNIASSIVENNFPDLHNNFDVLEKVFESIKIFSRLIKEEEKDAEILNLLFEYLEAMDVLAKNKETKENLEKCSLIEQGFIFKFLDLLGYKIETSRCIESGESLSKKNNYFNYSQGGMVCDRYARGMENTMAISNNSIKIIRIFFQNKLSSLSKLEVSKRDTDEIRRMSSSFIAWVC